MDDATFLRVLDALSVAISGLEQRVAALERSRAAVVGKVEPGGRACATLACEGRVPPEAPRHRRYCDACALGRQRAEKRRWRNEDNAKRRVNGAAVVEVVA